MEKRRWTKKIEESRKKQGIFFWKVNWANPISWYLVFVIIAFIFFRVIS